MTHYFSENDNTLKSNPQLIAFSVKNVPLKFKTDDGVFSKNSLDRGTEVLLNFLEINNDINSALDLGCGYGVIGIYINKKYNISVDLVDINERAVELAKHNALLNETSVSVIKSDGFKEVSRKYDLIITNPPIRIGKEMMYKLFSDAKNYLTEKGTFILVINKKHGADSAINELNNIYETVDILGHKKGFKVIQCKL